MAVVTTVPALTDAERLVGQLTYTLAQIVRYADVGIDGLANLVQAQELAIECEVLVKQAKGEQT